VANRGRSYSQGFSFAVGMDATVVPDTVVDFLVCGLKTRSLRPEGAVYQVRKSA